MERIEQYRQSIRQLLTSHATPEQNSDLDVECQLVFDTEQDYYQILDVGWEGANPTIFAQNWILPARSLQYRLYYNSIDPRRDTALPCPYCTSPTWDTL